MRIRASLLAIFLFGLVAAAAPAQTPFLVSDVGQGTYSYSSDPSDVREIDGRLFFTAEARGIGREPWSYADGTLTLLADFALGSYDSAPSAIWNIGGGVGLFSAEDYVHGRELWRTDGTAEGTSLVMDIRPSSGSNPTLRAVFENQLVFVADDGVHGFEPWISDGTFAGTRLLKDLTGTAASSSPASVVVAGGRIFLAGSYGLWVSDGSEEGTVRISAEPAYAMQPFGSNVLFSRSDSEHGLELWTSDGTPEGTRIVADVAPGSTNGLTAGTRAVVDGICYFLGAADGSGFDLWKTDGTEAGTQLVRSLAESHDDPIAPVMMSAGGILYIRVGGSVWRSDGTDAGTWVFEPDASLFNPGNAAAAFDGLYYFRGTQELWWSDGTSRTFVASFPPGDFRSMTFVGGKLYFRASDDEHGVELWVCEDGTAGTIHLAVNVNPELAVSSSPENLTASDGLLYFTAAEDGDDVELFRTDGTPEGTIRLTEFGEDDDDWRYPKLAGSHGSLFFRTSSWSVGLWRSDGSAEGTAELYGPEEEALEADGLFAAGSYLYFRRADSYSSRLWRTDGTEPGTIPLDSGLAPGDIPDVADLAELAGRVYATGTAGDRGIWETLGTPETTRRIASFEGYSTGGAAAAAAGALFFTNDTSESGHELWRSVGDDRPPHLVRDIAPGWQDANPSALTPAGRYLYFVASDGIHGAELWRTDGTEEGTVLLADIGEGWTGGGVMDLTAADRLLYFTATDPVHGKELWRSDGTPEGTELVADLVAGSASSSPAWLSFAGGTLWFAAYDPAYGIEPWRLDEDGIPEIVADLLPGSASSLPEGFVRAGELLYFSALADEGRELWAIPLAEVSWLDVDDVRVVEAGEGATARFTVTRGGSTASPATVQFTTSDGTAEAGLDYGAAAGVLSFEAGQESATVDVPILSDGDAEGNEWLLLELGPATGATLGRSVGTAIIEDDDRRADLTVEIVPRSYWDFYNTRRVRIRNAGPSRATDVRLRVSESPGDVVLTACADGNPLSCSLGSIDPGEETIVEVRREQETVGLFDSQFIPGYTVTADVEAAEPDGDLTDNLASVMMLPSGALMVPPFLTAGSNATATAVRLSSSSATVTLVSSSANVGVSPSSQPLPSDRDTVEFTLAAGPQSGKTQLTLTGGSSSAGGSLSLDVVPPGEAARLDVEVFARTTSAVHGNPVTLPVRIAARRHDGTLPSGVVTLFSNAARTTVAAQETLDETGVAGFTFEGLALGTHSYWIRYAGDGNFHGVDVGPVGVIVGPRPTVTTLEIPGPLCAGPALEIRIAVRDVAGSITPTGSVELTVGSSPKVTLPLAPTGVPGQAGVVTSHVFPKGSSYVAVKFLLAPEFAAATGGTWATVAGADASITAPERAGVGTTAAASVADAGAGAVYSWSIEGAAIVAGQGTRSIQFTRDSDGEALLDVTVTASGCTDRRQLAVLFEHPFDPNGDAATDPSDIFYLVSHLFSGGPPPQGGTGSGDANGDDVVDPADVFYLVNYLFSGGPAPASTSKDSR